MEGLETEFMVSVAQMLAAAVSIACVVIGAGIVFAVVLKMINERNKNDRQD